MTRKTSVKALARQAVRDDAKARAQAFHKPGTKVMKTATTGSPLASSVTADSFLNLAAKMGMGADNLLSMGTYGFNPITRQRQLLEFMYRGSWLAGVAIDCVADDMTRAGVDFLTELDDSDEIETEATRLNVWPQLGHAIRWGRLYGGGLAVHMVDGQDFRTPLRTESIGPDQYKGLTVLDRWMVEPVLDDLITDLGPDLGLPKYYRVLANAPAMRGQTIHFSRVAVRHVGIPLPYQQALTENLWGESVLERLHDRMVAYDSTSTGAAQLVFKAHLRTLKVDGLRDIVAAGGAAMNGLLAYTENMRRYQSIEGMSLVDKDDEFDTQVHGAFSGLDDIMMQFAMQLSGALQVPLTRLLGQSPAGMNATGESDMRNYYDGISQRQNSEMHGGVTTTYRCIAASKGVTLPDNFSIGFSSLWQMSPPEKADVAQKGGDAVGGALTNGIIGRRTALLELRQLGKQTGIFTNITDEAIEGADDEVAPPLAELETSLEHEGNQADLEREHQSTEAEAARKAASKEAEKGRQHALKLSKQKRIPLK